MITSLFGDSPFSEETEENIRKKLVKAAKARNLLENEDFKWWTENVIDKRVDGLIFEITWKNHNPENPMDGEVKKGMIRGINKVFQEIRKCASEVEDLERKLQDYDERKHPVARGA